MAPAWTRKSVADLGVLIDRNARIVFVRGAHLRGYFRRSVLIEFCVMQQQGAREVLRQIQLLVDAHPVISNRCVGLVANRGQVSEVASPAVTDHADGSVAAG